MYVDSYSTCAVTHASLGIFHDDLDPEEITRLLGLQPTRGWKRGEPRNPRARTPIPAKFGVWLLSTRGIVQSRDVRRHIDWLLDRAEPRGAVFKMLHERGCRTDLRCFWLSRGRAGG